MALGGAVLRFGALGLRILEFLCSAIVLGIFSYYLAVLADHDLVIAQRWQAVEGMSGAAVLYTIFGIVLVLCLGGVAFFGFLAVVLDVLFAGCFIAITYLTRHGASSCTGNVNTPLGSGPSDSSAPGYGQDGFGFGSDNNVTYFPNLHLACRLETAAFAVSIINIFLFLLTALWSVMMVRHHKKEKRFGPSPANNYTKGSGRRPFWRRQKKVHNTKDAEIATALPHSTHDRPTSGYTGSTVANNTYGGADNKYVHQNYAPPTTHTQPAYGQPGYGQTGTYHNNPHNAQF